MKITFTHHAQFRIMERGISALDVAKVLKNPDSQKMDVYGMMTVRKMVGKKTLEVIYRLSGKTHIIITAYYEN
jgi:hypothetical protein